MARNTGRNEVPDTSVLPRYSFRIETPKAYVSGIMLASRTDGGINGSMINEFGISAIDFSYSRKKDKLRLINVVSFLNKWYIKRILRNDIKFCLRILYDIPCASGHNYYYVRNHGDTVTIRNNKHDISYTFSPLTNIPGNNDTEK